MSNRVLVLLFVGLLLGVAAAGCTSTTKPKRDTPPVPLITTAPELQNGTTYRNAVIEFSGKGTKDKENDTLQFTWNFGDGTAPGVGVSVTHNFSKLGDYTVTLTVSETKHTKVSNSTTMEIHVVNRLPELTRTAPATADPSAKEGDTVRFAIEEYDRDGDAMTTTWWVDGQQNAGSTGTDLQLKLGFSSAGKIAVEVRVADGSGTSNLSWNLTVANSNRAPTITSFTPPDLSVSLAEASSQEFQISALDLDGDALTYTWYVATVQVSGASGVAHTLTTDYNSSGSTSVKAEVTDGVDVASTEWNVLVSNVNRPPVIDASSPTAATVTATEGVPSAFSVTASDPDKDGLSYRWTLDTAAVAGAIASAYAWSPPFNAQGSHTLSVTVSDQYGATADHTWTVDVTNVNRPPTLVTRFPTSNIPTQNENQTVMFSVNVTDPDLDTLTYAWKLDSVPQASVLIDNYAYTPTFVDAGAHKIELTASDPSAASIYTAWNITVKNVNRPPVAAFNASRPTAGFGVSIAFDGTASSDPDGDSLTFIWDFGDTQSGSGTTTSHTYGASGLYLALLTVRDQLNIEASANQTITIDVSQAWASGNLGTGGPTVVADVDKDGTLEIITGVLASGPESPAAVGTYSGYLYIFDGSTHNQEFQSVDIGLVTDIAVADIDADGTLEIVVGTWASTSSVAPPDQDFVGYLRVFGWSGAAYVQEWASPDVGRVGSVATGQLDAAVGTIEVAVSSATTQTVAGPLFRYDGNLRVYSGTGTPRFTSPAQGMATQIVVNDIDNDSVNEMLLGTYDHLDTGSFLSYGSVLKWGWNGATWVQENGIQIPELVNDLAVADVDRDGAQEAVIGTYSGNAVADTWDGKVHVYSASLATEETKNALLTTNVGEVLDLDALDIDGDNTPEILIGTRTAQAEDGAKPNLYHLTGYLWVYDGSTHNQKFKSANLGWVTDVTEGNLDVDAKKEVLAGGVTDDDRNTGQEKYTGTVTIYTGLTFIKAWGGPNIGRAGTDSMVVTDLDNDASPDFTVAAESDWTDPNTGTMRVFENAL